MTKMEAALAILAEVERAQAMYPPFDDRRAGIKQLRKQLADLEAPGWAHRGLSRELTQIAAVAIRMLAGV